MIESWRVLLCYPLGILPGLFFSHLDLFATPVGMMQNKDIIPVALGWQLLGFLGSALFASRFWYQWWKQKKNRASQLDTVFWKLSLLGNLVVLVYFFVIQDIVSIINYSFGDSLYSQINIIAPQSKCVVSIFGGLKTKKEILMLHGDDE
jgi:lipid-A-disaccharide synthase-like uncharacterized protein